MGGASPPGVALSHSSYAQIVASRSLRIPAVTAMDFEHQPANHVAFRLATTVLVPEVLPLDVIRRQGAVAAKVVRYPGLKQELCIGDFEPDHAILERSVSTPGLQSWRWRARPPPAPSTTLRLRNCIIPSTAIDSRSLVYAADVMIAAGGTMTREAAIMGIPTWTLFAGKTPAVDVSLEREGVLRRLTHADQLAHVAPRPTGPRKGKYTLEVIARQSCGSQTVTSPLKVVR